MANTKLDKNLSTYVLTTKLVSEVIKQSLLLFPIGILVIL